MFKKKFNKHLNSKHEKNFESFDGRIDHSMMEVVPVSKSSIRNKIIIGVATFALSVAGGYLIATMMSKNYKKITDESFTYDTTFAAYRLNNPIKTYNSENKPISADLSDALTEFVLDYNTLIGQNTNQIYSPVSIATCFSMLLEGAANNTEAELRNALHYPANFDYTAEIKKMLDNSTLEEKNKEGKTTSLLDINQSCWIDNTFNNKYNIKGEYIKTLTEDYYAPIFRGDLNYDSRIKSALADWINEMTRDFLNVKAEDFEELGGVLWLLNTIYLKTSWAGFPFLEAGNVQEDFNNLDSSKTNVTFMRRSEEQYIYVNDDYMINTFYLGLGLKFNVLLPNDGTDYGNILSNKDVQRDFFSSGHPNSTKLYRIVNEKLPKFKFQTKYDLVNIFKALGVKDVFNKEKSDLSNIAITENPLYVGNAVHEAGIEVNESGIEAAAYTMINVYEATSTGNDPEEINFYVDRPFMYSITDKYNTPLFVGTMCSMK